MSVQIKIIYERGEYMFLHNYRNYSVHVVNEFIDNWAYQDHMKGKS